MTASGAHVPVMRSGWWRVTCWKQPSGSEVRSFKSPKFQNVSVDKVTVAIGTHADFGFLVCGHTVCNRGGAMAILDVALQSSSRSATAAACPFPVR